MDKIKKKLNLLRSGTLHLIIIAFFQILAVDPALAGGDLMQAAPGQAVGFDLSLGTSENFLEIKAPGSIVNWILQPQESPNIWHETLVIKATGPWTISVSSDPITAGYMSEYDSANSEFIPWGHRLSDPLIIVAQDGNALDLSMGGVLIQGQGDKVVPITFEQKVVWSDPVLKEGNSYQIALTFSGLAG